MRSSESSLSEIVVFFVKLLGDLSSKCRSMLCSVFAVELVRFDVDK